MKKFTKAQKRKIKYFAVVIGVASFASLLIIVLFIGISHLFQSRGEKAKEVMAYDFSGIHVTKPVISEMFLTKNVNSRPAAPLNKINGLVIHYTANPGTDAEANRNYFESRKDFPDEAGYKVSSHYIVGLDGTIIQCIPENEIAYASNDRNSDTISIECCHPKKNGKYTKKTYQALIHLAAYLCAKYEIEPDKIIRHYDVTGKMCPIYYVKHPSAWKKLKSDVDHYLKKSVRAKN